jgi:Protein of unknown function (DUF1592)/Protein of unknown function (DUF1588)/Protein of unknown function (DUF1595)/Protein of unknown function (DUF1587)/Protein of unknown function (DUF1585)
VATGIASHWGTALALALCGSITACEDGSGLAVDVPSVGSVAGAAGEAATASCAPSGFAEPRLWRLTDPQYANTVRDVFGITVDDEVSGAVAEGTDGIALADVLSVGATTATNYQITAHRIALRAVADLPALLRCAAPDTACVDTFIREQVPRAFRRPLEAEEIADLQALYQQGAVDGPELGVRLVLEEVLQSPFFIWRTELGANTAPAQPGPVQLTAHEIASALSFLLLDSVPDDALSSKANDGTLADPQVLAAEADRLLALPAVKANLWKMAATWLGLAKTQAIHKETYFFPDYTPTAQAALAQSARLFVTDVVSHGGLTDLLTSRRVYVNEELAKLYGIPDVTGDALVPVEDQSGHRNAGIFTQPAFLAAYSRPTRGDPIHRGLFIYHSFICAAPIPPPSPEFLAQTFPVPSTERQLASLRAANPTCVACHGKFDPLGLLSERYDPIGRYRETDELGQSIDDSAVLAGLGADLDGPASGLDDLVSRLRPTRRVADCASAQLSAAALGRETASNQTCAMQAIRDAFADSGSFQELFKNIVTSPGFILRDPKRAEAEP